MSSTPHAATPKGSARRARVLAALLAAGCAFAPLSHAGPPAQRMLAQDAGRRTDAAGDMDFLLRAWQANTLELGAARLALRHAHDVRVRDFARDLVREHSAANLRWQRLALGRGLGIPAAIRDARPETEFGLEDLRGAAFDHRFIARVGIQAHRDAIGMYREEAVQGRDRTLQRLASEDLPVLRRQLARAEALQALFAVQRRNLGSPR